MITPNETDAPAHSPENTSMSDVFPNSKRIYVKGTLHDNVQVPMREVSLAETKHPNGRIEVNEPVRIYDNSGPWGDPDFDGNVGETDSRLCVANGFSIGAMSKNTRAARSNPKTTDTSPTNTPTAITLTNQPKTGSRNIPA